MQDLENVWIESREATAEEWLQYCQGKLYKHPPCKKWLLRSNVRTATRCLDCNECYIPICPGDSYLEEVYACKGKIEVKRYHWPECPRDPWDDEEFWNSDFDDVPETVPYKAPTPLLKAA